MNEKLVNFYKISDSFNKTSNLLEDFILLATEFLHPSKNGFAL